MPSIEQRLVLDGIKKSVCSGAPQCYFAVHHYSEIFLQIPKDVMVSMFADDIMAIRCKGKFSKTPIRCDAGG